MRIALMSRLKFRPSLRQTYRTNAQRFLAFGDPEHHAKLLADPNVHERVKQGLRLLKSGAEPKIRIPTDIIAGLEKIQEEPNAELLLEAIRAVIAGATGADFDHVAGAPTAQPAKPKDKVPKKR